MLHNVTNISDISIELLAFGRALRKIRKEKKLTQDKLRLYSLVDLSYISAHPVPVWTTMFRRYILSTPCIASLTAKRTTRSFGSSDPIFFIVGWMLSYERIFIFIVCKSVHSFNLLGGKCLHKVLDLYLIDGLFHALQHLFPLSVTSCDR